MLALKYRLPIITVITWVLLPSRYAFVFPLFRASVISHCSNFWSVKNKQKQNIYKQRRDKSAALKTLLSLSSSLYGRLNE